MCIFFENPRIQVSTTMSVIVKPRNFMPTEINDFTVLCSSLYVRLVFVGTDMYNILKQVVFEVS